VIEPKSLAGRRTVPLLAILRDYLEVCLRRTGRSGEDLIFGRTTEEAFYASTIDHRAKQAWKGAGVAAADKDEAASLPRPITLHECRRTFASLLIDAGANPKAIQQFMGIPRFRPPSTCTGICCPVATMRSGTHGRLSARRRPTAGSQVGG
jgi:integrase